MWRTTTSALQHCHATPHFAERVESRLPPEPTKSFEQAPSEANPSEQAPSRAHTWPGAGSLQSQTPASSNLPPEPAQRPLIDSLQSNPCQSDHVADHNQCPPALPRHTAFRRAGGWERNIPHLDPKWQAAIVYGSLYDKHASMKTAIIQQPQGLHPGSLDPPTTRPPSRGLAHQAYAVCLNSPTGLTRHLQDRCECGVRI